MKSLIIYAPIALVICGLCGFLSSCRKKGDTVAKVVVVNEQSQRIGGAEVELVANPNPPLKPTISSDLLFTDNEGEAFFDYTDDYQLGQAGFRVLDVMVNSGDTLFGMGVIKIVEEELNTVTVVISAP